MEWVEVGFSKKSFGINGEIRVVIEDHYLESAIAASVFMIKVRGDAVPFFVEDFKVIGDLLVKFEEVDTPEQTEQFKGKKLYMKEGEVEKKEVASNDLNFSYCLGFKLYNQESKLIGLVKEILEYPQQEMAILLYKGKEVLIPLHEDLIIKSNLEDKEIHLEISEGLLDL